MDRVSAQTTPPAMVENRPKWAMLQAMRLRAYLLLSFVAFVAATTGSDLIARTSVTGETLRYALSEHLHWAWVQAAGTMLLLAPFVAVGLVCAAVQERAKTRSAVAIFAAAMLTLLYFYYNGYQGAEYASLEHKWTAAALSVGLLPFFIGIPLVFAVVGAGALAANFDRRVSA